jgi:ACS family sodium-dependent inorganic phosphate cotransporter-like MFS transporter 5
MFQAERLFIESNSQSSKGNLPAPPFKSILTSVPYWAMVVTFFGYCWGQFTLISEIPTYLNNIQHIPLSSV